MSFVLPGNARSLRFTGEAKALTLPKPEAATTGSVVLGKPRVRKPPPSLSPPPTARVSTPPPSPRINTPTPGPASTTRPGAGVSPIVRHPPHHHHHHHPSVGYPSTASPTGESESGENPTMAMDRDALDVLPGGNALRAPRLPAFPNASPIPNFRPAMHHQGAAPMMMMAAHPPQTGSQHVKASSGAPLAIWLFAGIFAAILSFYVAPELLLQAPPRTAQQQQQLPQP